MLLSASRTSLVSPRLASPQSLSYSLDYLMNCIAHQFGDRSRGGGVWLLDCRIAGGADWHPGAGGQLGPIAADHAAVPSVWCELAGERGDRPHGGRAVCSGSAPLLAWRAPSRAGRLVDTVTVSVDTRTTARALKPARALLLIHMWIKRKYHVNNERKSRDWSSQPASSTGAALLPRLIELPREGEGEIYGRGWGFI